MCLYAGSFAEALLPYVDIMLNSWTAGPKFAFGRCNRNISATLNARRCGASVIKDVLQLSSRLLFTPDE